MTGHRYRPSPHLRTAGSLGPATRRAIAGTRQWLLDQQQADGCWCAELEGDTILESETILLWAFLGLEHTPLARRAAAYLIENQLPDGGWAMYPGGGVAINGSVKAYFALKLVGHDPSAEYMERARRAILAHGGADAVNSFTRFYLALLGQISYAQCPAVPPEMVLLPKWFPVNLYAVSSWSRTMIVPLSIISACQPVRRIEPGRGIRELFLRAAAALAAAALPGNDRRHRPAELGPLLPRRGKDVEVGPAVAADAVAPPGDCRRRAVDARTIPAQRRPGGDLSAHRLEHRGAAVLGLRRPERAAAILLQATRPTW